MRKTLQAFTLAIALLMTLLVAAQNQLVPVSVAHSGDVLSAWATRTPMIDGSISPRRTMHFPGGGFITVPGEYDDAVKVDFTLTYGSENHPATLWVKNDYINLYLAVEIRDEEYNDDDILHFNFDNNHNGVKEIGDDQLGLIGVSNQFVDNYFKADGSSEWDRMALGGHLDGAGFASYKTATSKWVFEMVHPLKSGDLAHDFSLSVGSTVGFNLVYWDNAGNNGAAGWPTFTFNDWTQMADILIAGPPTPPPSSSVDLQIDGIIEVTQAVQNLKSTLPLVQGKTTVVRITIDLYSATAPVPCTVFLYGFDGNGRSLGALSRSFNAPVNPWSRTIKDTANFQLPTSWVSSEVLELEAFVKVNPATQSETYYDNNWRSWMGSARTWTFKTTVVPTIYIIPVNSGSSTSPVVVSDAIITQAENYFRTIYPVASVNFVRLSWTLLGSYQPASPSSQLNSRLTQLGYQLGLRDGGIDQIWGFTTSGGGGSDPIWYGGHGIAASGYWGTSLEGTMAHEIDHNWGPGGVGGAPASPGWGRHIGGTDPWGRTADESDLDWPYRLEPEATRYQIHEYGFDTLNNWAIAKTTSSLMSYNMTPGSVRDPTDPMTMHSKWISDYRWEKVFSFLDPPAGATGVGTIQQVGESLMISGWVSKDGTGSLDPIFRIPGELESISIPGNFSLVLKDISGNPLLIHSFRDQFTSPEGELQDPYYFTMQLPWIANTSRVQLVYGNVTILDEINLTSHVPQVTVLSPNGGESWNTGIQNITWTGSDADNDTLTYRVYYSPDNGTTWTPISPSISETTYQIYAQTLEASNQSRIKVIATDGINIGVDLSNWSFQVMNHPPTATITSPYSSVLPVVPVMNPVILHGIGTDLDETLPESAYSWTSDVDGFLGFGHYLEVELISQGSHTITLTVTDSNGATATDSTDIFMLDFGMDYPSPPNPSLYNQTAVGQGYTAKFKVLVKNQGPIPRSFNVTASANGNSFQTIPIPDLPSGNSTYVELLWNTAGKPKGVYNITATITLPECEVTRLLNIVQISAVGDITGLILRLPDGKVDIRDLAMMAKIFGVIYPDIKYDPNCDLTGPAIGVPDDKVDIRDLAAAAKNYGKVDP